jgi:hypothetical protein
MDALAAVVWYGATVIVVCAAWKVARLAFPEDRAGQRTMHCLVCVWYWLVIICSVLGTVGMLNYVVLEYMALLTAAAIHRWPFRWLTSTPAAAELLKRDRRDARWTAWLFVWLGVAGLGGARVIIRGLLRFPEEWDTLMYHRPLIDHWLQNAALYAPACWLWQVPGNNELFGLWWAAPFSGDFWIPLMNIPGTVLMALGTFELGRLLDTRPIVRHATTLGALGTTVVFQQLTVAKNDVAVAALFLVAIAYGFRYVQQQCRSTLWMTGAAFGLLAGVKYYALGYVALGWIVLLVMVARESGRRAVVSFAVTTSVLMLVGAGYWYGRNLLVTGTPLYPVGYAGPDIAAALAPRSFWSSSIVGSGCPGVCSQYIDRIWKIAGPFYTCGVLIAPCSAAWLILSGFGLRGGETRRASAMMRLSLAIMLLGAWATFAVTPNTIDPNNNEQLDYPYLIARFSLVPLVLSLVSLSVMLSDGSRWIENRWTQTRVWSCASKAVVIVYVAAAVGSFSLKATQSLRESASLPLMLGFDLAALGAVCHAVSVRGALARRCAFTAAVVAGCAVFVGSTIWISAWWHRDFAAHYDRWDKAGTHTALTRPENVHARIASTYSRYYPFFGSRRQFGAFTPRRFASAESMFEYLATHNIDLLVVADETLVRLHRHPDVSAWVRAHPEVFVLTDVGARFSVFSVQKDALRNELVRTSMRVAAPALPGDRGRDSKLRDNRHVASPMSEHVLRRRAGSAETLKITGYDP